MTTAEMYLKTRAVSQSDVARMLGVNRSTVCRHIKREKPDGLTMAILDAADTISTGRTERYYKNKIERDFKKTQARDENGTF